MAIEKVLFTRMVRYYVLAVLNYAGYIKKHQISASRAVHVLSNLARPLQIALGTIWSLV